MSDIDDVNFQIRKALDVVSDLCNRRREWIMSIPAQPDHDPDLIIAHALFSSRNVIEMLNDQNKKMIGELEQMRKQLAKVPS